MGTVAEVPFQLEVHVNLRSPTSLYSGMPGCLEPSGRHSLRSPAAVSRACWTLCCSPVLWGLVCLLGHVLAMGPAQELANLLPPWTQLLEEEHPSPSTLLLISKLNPAFLVPCPSETILPSAHPSSTRSMWKGFCVPPFLPLEGFSSCSCSSVPHCLLAKSPIVLSHFHTV